MREILFRAKAINRDPGREYRTKYKNGDWVYGLLEKPRYPEFPELPAEMRNTDGVSGIEVDFDTIGQYTGLMDKNGVKIFEGDIVSLGGANYPVIFNTLGNCAEFALTDGVPFGFDYVHVPMEVVGNIYDNPELLNG
ncbi:MAG: hypothetical protein J6U19_05345 [Oscillospiraceae bacterium]|nr:hypothetical protein [Oscillospiraceae bacterium]